jgi:hypothetical protein
MTEENIFELIFGPLPEDQWISLADIEFADILKRLDTVELSTPVYPLAPRDLGIIKRVRKDLQAAAKPDSSRGPLSFEATMAESIIRQQLERYLEPDHQRADRIYVLEFQGPWQYVMYGHTTNLLARVAEHQRAAAPHGFALVNGWASPWTANAHMLEQTALFYAGLLHHQHYRERFFEMPFEFGLKIARLVFEKAPTGDRVPQTLN